MQVIASISELQMAPHYMHLQDHRALQLLCGAEFTVTLDDMELCSTQQLRVDVMMHLVYDHCKAAVASAAVCVSLQHLQFLHSFRLVHSHGMNIAKLLTTESCCPVTRSAIAETVIN